MGEDKFKKDPLIHGASPKLLAPEDSGASSAISNRNENLPTDIINLNASNPWQDLKKLYLSPKAFFQSLSIHNKPIGWIWFKAFLGFFIIYAILALVNEPQSAEDIDKILESFKISYDGPPGTIELIEPKLLAWRNFLVQYDIMQPFWAPLSALMGVLFQALSAFIFLPVFGVKRANYSLGQLIVILVYVQWVQILGVLPFLGGFAAWLTVMLLVIYSLSWVYKISFGRALLSAHLLGWVLFIASIGAAIGLGFGLLS